MALNFSGSGDANAIQTTQGQSYSGPVATFVGTPDGNTSNYSANINWGDGSTPAGGTITYQGGGTYEVTGSYTYEQEGTFGIQVGITEADDGAQVSVNSTADVAVAPTAASAITLPGILPTYSPNGPASNPTLPSGMNTFALNSSEISGSPAAWAPVFAASDPTAQPDQTITVTGSQFTDYPNLSNAFADTEFIVYGQTSASNGTFSNAKTQDPTLNGAMLTIDTSEPSNSLYLVWAVNGGGISAPIAINQTTAWWAGAPTEPVQQSQSIASVSAYLGQTLSVYGETLSNGAATPQSWVYLQPTGGAAGTWATVTAVNPYKVDFTVPSTLTVGGTYQIWINNGLGGQYSWSEAPTTLSVVASSAPTWSGTTINVTSYGAVGDGQTNDYTEIQSALNALQSGDTLEFPAGTYLVDYAPGDTQLHFPQRVPDIRIMGASAPTTTMLFEGVVPTVGGTWEFGQSEGGVEGTIEFDSMTFEYNGLDNSGYLINLRHSSNDVFNNVTLISGPLGVTDGTGLGELSIENSTIIGGSSGMGSVFFGGGSDDFINNDTFFLGYDSVAAVEGWGSSNVSVTNCTVHDYDDSADNVSGFGSGRILEEDAYWGSQSNYYLGNNTTINLTPDPRVNNVGEQINLEGDQEGDPPYYAPVVSATSDTVEIQDQNTAAFHASDSVVVVGGTGLGQLEPIAAVSHVGDLYTLTLSGNWNDTPDSTSTVAVVAEPYDEAFYSNNLSDAPNAGGNAGFEIWDGGYSDIFANNVVQNTGGGAVFASADEWQPDFFNQAVNDQFEDTQGGIVLTAGFESAPNNTPNDVGDLARDNSVEGVCNGNTSGGSISGKFVSSNPSDY